MLTPGPSRELRAGTEEPMLKAATLTTLKSHYNL